ncbi:MFS transporter [Xylophilus sp.]|uniref:MFS transporter n=1 Tax=Xylophilus sp. TaxID=2653893 RepID=UPI0013BD0235|nr:MFS transporter [Xylophilus sp.]KAF1046200.1 MAG: hypothetical protein GAK38_02597 [Xylophilus sp.]
MSPPAAAAPSPADLPFAAADRQARRAATVLGLCLPTDVVLYLLLPLYAARFGLTLSEVGVLLAANRLVRIAGYGQVSRLHARHGPRALCTAAALATAGCALGLTVLSGFWALLPLRLLWGLSYGALNLGVQALATGQARGAARRAGRAQAVVAAGPMFALPLAAALAMASGPRAIFWLLAAAALLAVPLARQLPAGPAAAAAPTAPRRLRLPGALDRWSFIEGLVLDGLFILGLTYLGRRALPESAALAAGVLMGSRYLSEMLLGPAGGRMAERWGALNLLVVLSLVTGVAVAGFGAASATHAVWVLAATVIVLRALQLPLVAPIVAQRHPGPERVPMLANRLVWRDLGAGIGPILAGLLLPAAPAWLLYAGAGVLLGWAALACRERPT